MEPIMHSGIKVVATDFMRVWVQARTHKKTRINKKWLKRYGYKQVPDMSAICIADVPGMGKVLFCHPKLYEKIKGALEEMEVPAAGGYHPPLQTAAQRWRGEE